jgi:ABC-2 type transport system ATP-binding protein
MKSVEVETVKVTKAFKRIEYDATTSGDSYSNPATFFTTVYYNFLSRGTQRTTCRAVDEVSLKVNKGEILGLLGPNGSGKTTLLKLISCLLRPTSGRVMIGGEDVTDADPLEVLRRVSFVPGLISGGVWVHPYLTVRRNLEIFTYTYGLDRTKIDEVLRMVGLEGVANTRTATLSTGMYGRLVLAGGMLKESPIYLMDEPTIGLSRETSVDILKYTKEHICRELGATVIYATNNIEECENLADRVGILIGGKLKVLDTPRNLARLVKMREVIEMELVGSKAIAERLASGHSIAKSNVELLDETMGVLKLLLQVDDSRQVLPGLVDSAIRLGSKIQYIRIREPTLEDAFLDIVRDQSGGDDHGY